MARKSLGKGLASLIPDFYNEDFDSNSTQSLEDIMNETENNEEIKDSEEKNAPKEKSSNDINNNSNEEEISKDETLEESGNDETQKNIFEEIEEEKNNQEKSIDSNETTLKEDVSENIKESENISIQNNEKNTSTTQETTKIIKMKLKTMSKINLQNLMLLIKMRVTQQNWQKN